MSSVYTPPGTRCSQSSLDVSKADTNNPEIKVSSRDVLSHHTFTEKVQCENTNMASEKTSPSLPQISPQEELRGQPHSMTAAGSKNNMTLQDRPPPFSSKEAQGEGPTKQEKDLSPPSPETPPGRINSQRQIAPRVPFKRRVCKSLQSRIIKGLRSLCCCQPTEKREHLANNKILPVSYTCCGGSHGNR